MDYRIASNWRAWHARREQPGICEDTEQEPTAQFWNNDTAEVPFVFKLCKSRKKDF